MSLPFLAKRTFSTSIPNLYKVTVLGACGGIGQPLSLLLKLNNKVTDLRLYDIKNAKGVATDLSHIPTASKVNGYSADENSGLANSLDSTDLIVIPAGIPRKPGMTRDDLFNINAKIVHDLAVASAKHAPNAAVLVISNPINSTVPIVAKVLQKNGTYNPKKLFGVTTLDSIRASTFISEIVKTDPTNEKVNIIGGHSGITIIPVLSQTSYYNRLSDDEKTNLINRIQFGGDEVVKAKNGAGSATLSMAYAGSRFANAVLDGFEGKQNVVEASFVDSPLFKDEGIDFFATNVTLGTDGIEKIHDFGELQPEEISLLENCKETLKKNIKKGYEFVESN
ncbi:hypothetical protein KAFR_0C03960 [Kazachstania africana CBS 2517]|uniref:Malate dehydrogenase n=1 Tax=Kazachstania africana (strain ATCC 22294 / BCRC 22015 / CBS 2517 / CECT 1963 / NBRC 1671 / NRRL Y-8276) TaxID=1071382 RepID=H2ASN7_KAZAF|nr:hypothetical protein KAFR_0C03960 [Kazachstania africana CBS 2517]CCF57387.1 hypothetical protein KAFR_0C03960 [Kazachstania africana CBS 2517]